MVHTSSSNVWASRWKCFHFTSLIVYIFGRMMMILEDFFRALWTGLPKTTTDYCVAASEIRYTRHASALGYLNVWAYGIHAGLHVRCTFVDCWELVEPVRSFGEYPLRFFFAMHVQYAAWISVSECCVWSACNNPFGCICKLREIISKRRNHVQLAVGYTVSLWEKTGSDSVHSRALFKLQQADDPYRNVF